MTLPSLEHSGSTAILSSCGRYRYTLTRHVGGDPMRRIVWVMLNPSTADAREDDPTIRRCIGYSRRWGFGTMEVVNLFAYRATDPAELTFAIDPVGPDNDGHILSTIHSATTVLCAWGSHPMAAQRRGDVLRMIGRRGLALAVNKDGNPRHPLYCRGDLMPMPYGATS